MLDVLNNKLCNGCTACVVACPVQCIQMRKDNEGFYYPFIDNQLCINCGLCEKKCPINTKRQNNEELGTYAAKTLSDSIRKKSSSGGIFSELAIWVLRQKGIVIGAGFNQDFCVEHMCIDNENDLTKLIGSKYVQSYMGTMFVTAKKYLDKNRIVLFSGTPCQISGLYQFLGKEYENLITQDIICHGVPSPMVWEKYLEYHKRKYNRSSINNILFRDKITGWNHYSFTIEHEKGKIYSVPYTKNKMMKAFLSNMCLRPSCYNCAFKQLIKNSDITLADFWGSTYYFPEWDDDKGVSLVMLNSTKGKYAFENIESKLDYKKVNRKNALEHNVLAVQSAKRPKERENFLECVRVKGFGYASNKYLRVSFAKKVMSKLKKF